MKKYLTIMLLLFSFNTFAAEPYFISTLCKSARTVLNQTTTMTFTSNPGKYDTIKDSTFSCNGDKCTWFYTIKKIDTLVKESPFFSYTTVDSSFYVDTLSFSFFDADNDSCRFVIAGLDSDGKKVYADSLWGDIKSRPGSDKKIYFSHKKAFTKIFPGIIQLSYPGDTISESIDYSSTSIINQITDSSFFKKLNGAWKMVYQQTSYYPMYGDPGSNGSFVDSSGCFFDSDIASEYNKDKVIIYSTPFDRYIRYGWCLTKKDQSASEKLNNVIVVGDTLITTTTSRGGASSSRYVFTYVYVRDTSLKISDLLPVKRQSVQKSDAFKVKISSDKIHPVISFSLPQRHATSLSIYDLSGRLVMKYFEQILDAGPHEIRISSRLLSGKTYICKLAADGTVVAKQFTIAK